MSLLKNVLRSVFSPAETVGPELASTRPQSYPPTPEPAVQRADEARHVWHMLDAETGVQDCEYPANPRSDIQALFGHMPRRVLDVGCATGAVGLGLKRAIPGLWVWGCEVNARTAQVASTRLDDV